MAGLHDTTHTPAALWQLDGDLLDYSGAGLTLTQSRGNTRFGEIIPGWRGYLSIGALLSELSRTVTDAGLLLLGDMSIGLITRAALGTGGGTDFLVGFGTAWGLYFDAGGTTNVLVWKQAAATFTSNIHFAPYQPIALYATRISNVIRLYVDGRKVATSGALAAPSGNATSKLYIQANNGSSYNGGSAFSSIKVTPIGLTDSEVLAEHERTLGLIYPRLAA